MTTINLRDGLEVLYYFGEQDFDPQRNQLQDHSGYGRHATANGGPTVGVNGPNDFEATGLDGVDDYFNNYFNGNIGTSEATISMLVNLTGNSGTGLMNMGTNIAPRIILNTSNGDVFKIRVWNDAGGRVDLRNEFFSRYNEPLLITFRFDNGQFDTFYGEEKIGGLSVSSIGSPNLRNPITQFDVGDGKMSGRRLDGSISLAGLWSRPLSYRGIQRLNDMTAPLRAQL